MSYLLLVIAAFFLSFGGIGVNFYNQKNVGRRGSDRLYILIETCVVFLIWLVKFLISPDVDLAVLPYSMLLAAGYVATMLVSVPAYKEGSLMLTSLIMQLSGVTTSIWGFFFWDSPITLYVIIGLVLVVLSLWLCLFNGRTAENGKRNITAKWLFLIFVYLVGNTLSSIVQRTQQIDFNSAYGDFLMMIATGISLIVLIILYIRSDRSDAISILKCSWYLPLIAGILTLLINVIVLILATSSLSPTLIYPFLSVGSLIIVTVFSLFIFKEKMMWWQWIGVVIGIIAVWFLSM